MQVAADGQEYSLREAIEKLAQNFRLNDEERQEALPSGRQATFDNRVGWARTYLKKAGLLKSTRRGYFQITPEGQVALQKHPPKIDVKFLENFPEFIEFRKSKKDQTEVNGLTTSVQEITPEENLESIIQGLVQDLASELLDNIKSCSPSFFETLVVDVLVGMGYGGTRQDAGRTVGRSGDGGIDGIIGSVLDLCFAAKYEEP